MFTDWETIMDEQFRQHGAFSWCDLMTSDVAAAKAFYTRLFGWETEEMSMPDMSYTVVKAGGKGVGGITSMPKDAAPGMPPMWGAYVTVKDVDATARMAQQLGGKLLVAPQDIPE